MGAHRRRTIDDHGTTIVEVLVCLVILSIILMMISNYMSSGTRVYHRGSVEVDLQIELQMVIDHVSEEMLECQSITTLESGKRYLLRKTRDQALVVILDSENSTLYQRFIQVSSSEVSFDGDLDANYFEKLKEYASANDSSDMVTISEYVTEFGIKKVGAPSSHLYSVQVKVGMEDNEKTTTKQVTLRNGR